jgi:Family of unknown function (DUF5906)
MSGYRMTAKACGKSHQEFRDKKWTDQQMIEHGYLEPANEATAAPASKWKSLVAEGEARQAAAASAPPETGHGKLITISAQPTLFAGCVYVQALNQIMVPEGTTLKKEQFENDPRFSGRSYALDANGIEAKGAWDCFLQSKAVQFPKVRDLYFDPRDPAGQITERDGMAYINSWRPLNIASTPGDVTPFLAHAQLLLPKGEDAWVLMSYLAACVQHLGHKAAWAIFLQGVEGNGKTFFTKVMQYCLGKIYVHNAAADDLGNNFNAAFYGKLFVGVEEVLVDEGKKQLWNKLKTLITDRDQEVTPKGVDKATRELCMNFIFNSNHKDGLRKSPNDRRICPLYTAQQTKEDLLRDGMIDNLDSEESAYFDRLWSWFESGGNAHVLHYLQHFPIPDKYNFAKRCRRAPRTSSTDEALQAGLGGVEQAILAAVADGRQGFRGGWISSYYLTRLLMELRKDHQISLNMRALILRDIGYVPHPQLARGRANNPLRTGEGKSTLYVTPDHPTAKAQMSPSAVEAAYVSANADPTHTT